jgi:hypothetical protein
MADTSAGGHPKLSFAAAARAVATSTNKEKFERLKASREKAKTKLALARLEIARCAHMPYVWAPCTACAAPRLSAPAGARAAQAAAGGRRVGGHARSVQRSGASSRLSAFQAPASSRALHLPARLTLARAKLRRENDELRRALLAQLPDADDDEAGDAAGAEQMLRAALSSEQRLRAETTAELAYLRTALWGTSGLAAASLVALAYSRLTRA